MKGIGIIFLSIGFLWSLCGSANSADLIFSDDFNRAEVGDNWITGASPPECGSDSITIVDGRIQATENCNFIETTQIFSGNLRIEFDVEKVGSGIYDCWDFWVAIGGKKTGVIRFDFDDVDGIAIDLTSPCRVQESFDGGGPNKGKAIYILKDGILHFEFINADLEVLFATSQFVDNFSPGSLTISIAGEANTPRYIDNVRVYSLPTLPLADLDKDGDVDGTDLDKFSNDFGFTTND